MNILVIGGMHGNEPLGIALVKKLQKFPIKGVTAITANDQAIQKDVRFTKSDLNRSFPGDANAKTYETTRAKEILELCTSFDLVLDFHNTYCPDNDCSFLGETASSKLYGISSSLGLNRIIVADYDCLNKYAPNCLSVEVSMDSAQNNVDSWYEKLVLLQVDSLQPKGVVETYRFVYRMSIDDRNRLGLDDLPLKAFQPLPRWVSDKLGVLYPAYPIFIGDAFTPYNFGGVLIKAGNS